MYEVFEDEKSVEVCLMLVGDKSQFLSSTINVTLETNTTPSTFHVKGVCVCVCVQLVNCMATWQAMEKKWQVLKFGDLAVYFIRIGHCDSF